MRIAGLALLLAACGARPEGGAVQALYDDLRAVVVTRERVDWTIDRTELADSTSDLLGSVCRTPPADRAALRRWLDAEITASGGPSRPRFEQNGGELGPLSQTLTLERITLALDHGERLAAADCPYWMRPAADFEGVQSDTGRVVLHLESMGGAQLLRDGGSTTLGGFGVGRLLPGYGLTRRLTLAVGFEAGVASTFPQDEEGRQVRPRALLGAPLLLRVREETWRFDSELAATWRATRGEIRDLRPGFRVTQGAGIAALRIAGAMPYGIFWLGYEYLPPWHGAPALHALLVGTRVGLNWDP